MGLVATLIWTVVVFTVGWGLGRLFGYAAGKRSGGVGDRERLGKL